MRIELLVENETLQRAWREALQNRWSVHLCERLEASDEEKIVIVDFHSKKSEVLDYLKHRSQGKPLRLIVLEGVPDITCGKKLIADGVRAYGNAYMAPQTLYGCVDAVAQGYIWLYPEFVSTLVREMFETEKEKPSLPTILTTRQKEIVEALLRGYSNKEIAERLEITERTVKAHLSAIYAKFGVSNRFELAVALKRRENKQ